MKKTILFGTGRIAEVISYLMTKESDVEVAGFTVDRKFLKSDRFQSQPVVPFEEVQDCFPPDEFDLFVALGYQQMNSLREDRICRAEEKGYSIATFVHPRSTIPTTTHVGKNSFIMNNVCIHPRVRLGDNVFIWSGAMIGHHSSIGHNTWVTSNASIAGCVEVGSNCFFAVNATVVHNVKIGDRCFLGASSLVTKNMPSGSVAVAPPSEVLRVNSDQFLKMTRFS